MTITLEIPDDIYAAMMTGGGDLSRRALEALAFWQHWAGNLSLMDVQEMLGFETLAEAERFIAERT